MPRLFFGLEIAPEIKHRLLTVTTEVPGASWQSAEQLHLTLLFLGGVEQQRLTAIGDAARGIHADPFPLQVTGLSCFGQSKTPRNLWARVQPAAPVARLHGALQERMAALGFATERRTFRPHITLARFKRETGSVEAVLAEQAARVFGEFPVTEFVLFKSETDPAGSVYTVVERFPLRSSPAAPT